MTAMPFVNYLHPDPDFSKGLYVTPSSPKGLYEAALESDDYCATQAASQRLRDFQQLNEILSK